MLDIERYADSDHVAAMIDRIRALLRRDPLCLDIVRYLVSHTRAVDTASGIAAWWVHGDATATDAALAKLAALGVVETHDVGTRVFYRFTRNRPLRRAVARCVKDLDTMTRAGGYPC